MGAGGQIQPRKQRKQRHLRFTLLTALLLVCCGRSGRQQSTAPAPAAPTSDEAAAEAPEDEAAAEEPDSSDEAPAGDMDAFEDDVAQEATPMAPNEAGGPGWVNHFDASVAGDVPVLFDPSRLPTAKAHHRHYGVHPTVPTGTRARVRLSAGYDLASFEFVRHQLDHGDFPAPASVRVESLAQALLRLLPSPGDDPELGAHLIEGFHRPGFELLTASLRAHRAEEPVRGRVTVASAVGPGNHEGTAGVQRFVNEVAGLNGYRDIERARTGLMKVEALDRVLERTRELSPGETLLILSDGHFKHGEDTRLELLDLRARGVLIWLLGVGYDGYNDSAMRSLARATGAPYVHLWAVLDNFDKFAGLLGYRPHWNNVEMELRFERANVERFRLLGHEVDQAGGRLTAMPAAPLYPEQAVVAVAEVQLRERAGPEIAEVRVRGRAWTEQRLRDKRVVQRTQRTRFAEAPVEARLVALAALLGEKLRSSYWTRELEWATLRRLSEAFTRDEVRPQGQRRLQGLIQAAMAAAERHGDAGARDFEQLPVLLQ